MYSYTYLGISGLDKTDICAKCYFHKEQFISISSDNL